MNNQLTIIAYRKKTSLWSLVPYFILYPLFIFLNIGILAFWIIYFSLDYSLYVIIAMVILFGGLFIYLLVDTILFINKQKRNNQVNQECLYYNPRQKLLLCYALDGTYQIPLSYLKNSSGDRLFSHSLLSITYVNKNQKKQVIEIGIIEHIRQVRRHLKSLYSPR
ncbi:MAG: hypothetical protein WC201_04865 [Bacilli bacterium]